MPSAITTFKATAELTSDFSVECSARGHKFILDETKSLGGKDGGMNPIEATLSALGACQAIIAKLFAATRGIELKGFRMELEGDIDVSAFEKIDAHPHIEAIRTKVFIQSDSNEEDIRDFIQFVEDNCPVADILKNPAQMIPEVIIERDE